MKTLLVTVALLVPGPAPVTRTGTLVVLNKSEATASLLDLSSGKIAATVSVGTAPHEVDVSPDGKLAIVANYGAEKEGSTLTLIDIPRAAVISTIDLGEYRRPHGIKFLPDGKRVAVTSEVSQALLLVDVLAGKVIRSLPTGQKTSHMVALDPGGARAYVASIGSGTVTGLDLEKGEVIKVVATGAGAEGIAVSPDGKEVWVTNRAADSVSVVDARSLQVSRSLPSASFPIRVRFTPDGRHALVSNAKSGDVAVFDTATRAEVRRIPMKVPAGDPKGRLFQFGSSPAPIGILIPPGGKLAYIANSNADAISVLDLETWEIVDVLKAGKEPDGLGWSALTVSKR